MRNPQNENGANERTTGNRFNSGAGFLSNACMKVFAKSALYGMTPAERAQETGMAQQTLRRTAEAFEAEGMVSVFRPTRAERASHHRSLPVPMRQLIVDLKTQRPGFTLREIAKICAIQFGRQPSHNTVKQVLADGPLPTLPTRHSPHYADIPDPAERRLVVIRLHAASDGGK